MTKLLKFIIEVHIPDNSTVYNPQFIAHLEKQYTKFIYVAIYPQLGSHEYKVYCVSNDIGIDLC